jgi:hypothetical protein
MNKPESSLFCTLIRGELLNAVIEDIKAYATKRAGVVS